MATSPPALKDFVFLPPAGSLRGTAVLVHGHGDHSARYADILDPFLSRGIGCFSTDLPGHGESEGKRGHVPGIESVDRIVAASHARARAACPEGPVILIGHSVGGLLALRQLLREQPAFDCAWISSPLLRPDTTRHPVMVNLLRFAGWLFPGITVDTGVTPEDCRHFASEAEAKAWEEGSFHSRINLGWGRALLTVAKEVRREYAVHPPTLPLLFTQGTADPVCRPEFLRELLASSALPNATLLEFQDQRHEPFVDNAREEVREAVGNWLDIRLATSTQCISPCG